MLDAAPITTAGVPPLSAPVNVSNAPVQKINRAVPRPPSSNSPAGPDSNAPGASTKGFIYLFKFLFDSSSKYLLILMCLLMI